jgi:hypothetical protein
MATYPVNEQQRKRPKKRKSVWKFFRSPRFFRGMMKFVQLLNGICRLINALRQLL